MAKDRSIRGKNGEFQGSRPEPKSNPTPQYDVNNTPMVSEPVQVNNVDGGMHSMLSVTLRAQCRETTFPQANNLDLVAAVPHLVNEKLNTSSAISFGLGGNSRTGNYYLNAAESLGFVEKHESWGNSHEYQLTPAGEGFVESDHETQTLLLTDAVEQNPWVRLRQHDEAAFLMAAEESVESDDTIERRTACVDSWISSTKDPDKLAGDVTRGKLDALRRSEDYVPPQRMKPKAEKPPTYCSATGCSMTLSTVEAAAAKPHCYMHA